MSQNPTSDSTRPVARTRRRSQLAVALIAGLMVSGLGVGASPAPRAAASVAAEPSFADVTDPSSPFYTFIEWMFQRGISLGTAQLPAKPLYKPADAVSRQAMALFMYRLSGATFAPPASPTFGDVPTTSQFYSAIEWMASRGISAGTAQPSGPPLFKPSDPVSRQAMALFVARYAGANLTIAPTTPRFTDVPVGASSAAAIDWMFVSGVSRGTPQLPGLPLYLPSDPVSRQAMAAFLYRVDQLRLGPVEPTGTPTVIAGGLKLPWSMVRLATGSTLVSERDTALIMEVLANGTVRQMAAVPGVVPAGEGGLLGLEVVGAKLFAYITTASDNRIVSFDLLGGPGTYSLGTATPILIGIPRANTHNGGRIKVGPDGMLYATVGDVQNLAAPQNLDSLGGKILRMGLDGSVPADNPFPGSLVYSLGHRNPQGIAWDSSGQLWSTEFGQSTWDEFNMITPGANYGWPTVEGIGTNPAFVNPRFQWSTAAASPSGLAFTRDTFFVAALRGQRVWAVYPTAASATALDFYAGQYGRIRDVVAGPAGTLWILTNNYVGSGAGTDRILQVQLVPRPTS